MQSSLKSPDGLLGWRITRRKYAPRFADLCPQGSFVVFFPCRQADGIPREARSLSPPSFADAAGHRLRVGRLALMDGVPLPAGHPADQMGATASPWRYDWLDVNVQQSACAQIGRMVIFGMRVISRRTLREFVEGRRGYKDHAALKAALDAWFDEVKKARWSSAADVKRSYATASIVSADRIVFNIKGNDYRLVVATDFDKGIVWIKWIGTHKDYDKIDVKGVRHGR